MPRRGKSTTGRREVAEMGNSSSNLGEKFEFKDGVITSEDPF